MKCFMVIFFIFLRTYSVLVCASNESNFDEVLSESTKTIHLIKYEYNELNNLQKEKYYIIDQKENVVSDTNIEYTRYYIYENGGKLMKEVTYRDIGYISGSPNIMTKSYNYNKKNELESTIKIDYLRDTFEIEYVSNYMEDTMNVAKYITLSKQFLLPGKDTLSYDTTFHIVKFFEKDGLRKLSNVYNVENNKEVLNYVVYFKYNNTGNRIESYTLNSSNDTIEVVTYEYVNDKLNKSIRINKNINKRTIGYYDDNECLTKLIIDDLKDDKESHYYIKNDKNCNVLERRWIE